MFKFTTYTNNRIIKFFEARSLTIFYMIAILVLLHQNVGGMCPVSFLGFKNMIPIFKKNFNQSEQMERISCSH